ncbi:MAG: alpha/beta hydrolase [Anaerolineales bacterium]|nr:alpha/beta hydrolase [Anaerolineae bacterium]PWB75147.1 MAG: alpha/beta hydrolase [Anaerolineales bacterium]
MSSITTDQGIVHYEVYGRGKPVILLHGWLGSWGLWQETMAFLGRYYRTYALDFWGFGESGKKRETYAVQDFVSLVNQFMEQLGIMRAPLVGHSMGGTVSLSVAIRYPERVSKVVVVGSPIVGSSLAFPLKLAGYRPIAFMLFNMMGAFRLGMRIASPIICRDERFADMMDRDLSRTTLESFLLSIASLRRTDLRPMLDQIKVPAMGMYGDRDVIVHPKQWQPMQKGIPQAHIERFPVAGHFPMLEEPQNFAEKLKTFLDREEEEPVQTRQTQSSPLNTTSVTLAP